MTNVLSHRELEVFRMVCDGSFLTTGEAAYRLCVTEQTIKNHMNEVYAKLQRLGAISPERARHKTDAAVWLYWAKQVYTGRWM